MQVGRESGKSGRGSGKQGMHHHPQAIDLGQGVLSGLRPNTGMVARGAYGAGRPPTDTPDRPVLPKGKGA